MVRASEDTRQAVLKLREQGLTHREIAAELDVSRGTVANVLSAAGETTTVKLTCDTCGGGFIVRREAVEHVHACPFCGANPVHLTQHTDREADT